MSKSFYFKPLPPTAQNAMVWAVTLRIFSYLTWLALSHLDCKGKHGIFIELAEQICFANIQAPQQKALIIISSQGRSLLTLRWSQVSIWVYFLHLNVANN